MDYYRRRILDGSLAEGDRLPSVIEIGRDFGISSGTAARGIGQLQVEGLVRSSPQGTFVATLQPAGDSPRDRIIRAHSAGDPGSAAEMEVVRYAEIIRVPLYVADLMDLDPAGDVLRREWVTLAGRKPKAEPVMFSVSWFRPELAASLPELAEVKPVAGGTVRLVEKHTGHAVTHGEDHMHGRGADAREASALGIPVGAAILAGAYLWTDSDGTVMEYGEFCLPPRRTLRYRYPVDAAPES